jgi:hypothetical protein
LLHYYLLLPPQLLEERPELNSPLPLERRPPQEDDDSDEPVEPKIPPLELEPLLLDPEPPPLEPNQLRLLEPPDALEISVLPKVLLLCNDPLDDVLNLEKNP